MVILTPGGGFPAETKKGNERGRGGGTSIKSMQLLKKDVRDQGFYFELI